MAGYPNQLSLKSTKQFFIIRKTILLAHQYRSLVNTYSNLIQWIQYGRLNRLTFSYLDFSRSLDFNLTD